MEKSQIVHNNQVAAPRRVLCFSPYNRWQLHGVWEMTILHGLRLRNSDVKHVFCDGQFTDCDIHWKATSPRKFNSCIECQAAVTDLAKQLSSPFEWLSQFIRPDERAKALDWAQGVNSAEFQSATFDQMPIGEWAIKSVRQHFRNSILDVSDPDVEQAWRSYLYSTLLASFAAKRLFDEYKPDTVFLFNGMFSVIRPFNELAKQLGLPVIIHERGRRMGAVNIMPGDESAIQVYRNMWDQWKNIPLSQEQLITIDRFLEDRRHGRNQAWHSLNPQPENLSVIRERLRLQEDRQVWVMFPSSDDEAASFRESKEGYGDQEKWIEHTIEFAKDHPEIDLIIRVHPNINNSARGMNKRQYNYFKLLKDNATGNIRVILPEDNFSSYSLMDIATIGLVYMSQTGIELGALGKHVILASGAFFSNAEFVSTAENPAHYQTLLEEALQVPVDHYDVEIQRMALRFAYGTFFRIGVDLPLVTMPQVHRGEITYSSLEALLPGKDKGLDRICDIILNQRNVYDSPEQHDLIRTKSDEDQFLLKFWISPAQISRQSSTESK